MQKKLELTYEKFREIVENKISAMFPNIKHSNEWELKVLLSEELCLKVNLKDAWSQYEKTKNINVLLDFIKTQSDQLMCLDSNEKTFNDIKDNLIPSIRSTELLEKMNAFDYIIQRDIGKNLKSVILFDQERYTQVINKDLYPSLPSDEEVFEVAINNLKNRGWVPPSKIYSEEPFELFVFEEREYSSHYQFFIREWLDKEIGDCYISFPTNKIALVMKLKTSDWRDWIKCLNFFSKTARKTFVEEAFPLSDVVIKYENGKYDIL